MVVGAIATGDNYKGRWTAARSAVRMYDAAYAADKAEVHFAIYKPAPCPCVESHASALPHLHGMFAISKTP